MLPLLCHCSLRRMPVNAPICSFGINFMDIVATVED